MNLLPKVRCLYRWENKVQVEDEYMLLVKTTVSRLQELEARLHTLHGYKVPKFLVIVAESGSEGYVEWLGEAVSRHHPEGTSAI